MNPVAMHDRHAHLAGMVIAAEREGCCGTRRLRWRHAERQGAILNAIEGTLRQIPPGGRTSAATTSAAVNTLSPNPIRRLSLDRTAIAFHSRNPAPPSACALPNDRIAPTAAPLTLGLRVAGPTIQVAASPITASLAPA
jgi:hypothetical protein